MDHSKSGLPDFERHEQIPVQKQVSHFATRLGDEQTAVARGAMGGAIAAAVVGIMIGADRIVGADCGAF
jgi:hypothetical protein